MTVITGTPTSSILEASLGFRAARWAPAQQNLFHAGKVHNGWNVHGKQESFIFLFFTIPRLITVTLNVKLSAHARADPCQICSKSSTVLVSFYSFVLFCFLLQLQLCCIQMASSFPVELLEILQLF